MSTMNQHISKSVKRTILLNPGPGTTSQAVKEALVVDDICPREVDFGKLMQDISEGLLKIGNGTGTHEVALFVASGTGAMEATFISAIGPKDRVLILTNGAYGYRMESICKAFRLPCETLFSFGDYPDSTSVEEKLKTCSFTHLAFIHHETSTGMMNPLDELVMLSKKYKVKTIVDAMSTFGAYPFDFQKTPVDYLFSSSNKCIQGMAGLSFVIFSKDCKEELRSNSGGFYFDVYKQWEGLQKNGQLRFTPPVQICHSFQVAIQETLKEGLANRWKRYTENWEVLFAGFTRLGFVPFLKREWESQILLALKIESVAGFHFDAYHDYMLEHGVTVYPGVIPQTNTFRVAVIGDLYKSDMELVVKLTEDYLGTR